MYQKRQVNEINYAHKIKLNKRGNVDVDLETMKTYKEGVFAGGNIVNRRATLILAMGAGRKATKTIHDYIQDKKEVK